MNTDTNLAVVLKTNITDPDEITDLTLTALVYNDGSGRVKFPSGNVTFATRQEAPSKTRWKRRVGQRKPMPTP